MLRPPLCHRKVTGSQVLTFVCCCSPAFKSPHGALLCFCPPCLWPQSEHNHCMESCRVRGCFVSFLKVFFFHRSFVDVRSPCWVKHEKCIQVGCSEMSIEKSKRSGWCWRGCWSDKSSVSWQRSRGQEEEEGEGRHGKRWRTARWGLLNREPVGLAPRHTLFKGVIQSVPPDAKSFATRWPFRGLVLSVSYFPDLSLLLFALLGNDDRYTCALQISSIGHYCLHQRSCYTTKSLMDDGYRNGFPGKIISKHTFQCGECFLFLCVDSKWLNSLFLSGLIRLKIAVGCLPYCHFPLQTEVFNNAMAVSRCECHGGNRWREFKLPRQPAHLTDWWITTAQWLHVNKGTRKGSYLRLH